LGDVCYHSFEKAVFPIYSLKSQEIKTHTITILPPVLCLCENWSPAFTEEIGFRVPGYGMLMKMGSVLALEGEVTGQ
jgi:hypothetical protein